MRLVKSMICGACVALAVIGVELAAGIEMDFGTRLLIVCPLAVIVGTLCRGDR